MSFPLFRFTLNNPIVGPLVISEPGGWDEAVLKLERNEEYHSLVEFYDQPLLFYGQDATENGGLDYITEIEKGQGPDAQIKIYVEISEESDPAPETSVYNGNIITSGGKVRIQINGVNLTTVYPVGTSVKLISNEGTYFFRTTVFTVSFAFGNTLITLNYGGILSTTVSGTISIDPDWTILYSGMLDITSLKEIDFYKSECGVIRDDFWQKFINRKGTPVDLAAVVDLDGNASTSFPPYTLNLPCQPVRKKYYGRNLGNFTLGGTDDVIQYDVDDEVYAEFDSVYHIPTERLTTNFTVGTAIKFAIAEAGSYAFDLRIEGSDYDTGLVTTAFDTTDWWIRRTGAADVIFTRVDFTDGLGNNSTVHTYNATLSLSIGDEISIVGLTTINDPIVPLIYGIDNSTTGIAPPSGVTEPTYFIIIADTITPDTSTDAYLISDAINSVISKIIGHGAAMTSTWFASACGFYYSIMRGLHVRGYLMTDKPFFLSFDDIWAGVNPIMNLGLGYTSIAGTDYIEIAEKEDFYNTTPLLNLDYVNKIERSYDVKNIFKSIEIGYQKWSAESGSGIDDPQSKRIYRTRFKTVGEDNKTLSKFVAASLAIEQARRQRKEIDDDYRLDEDVIIIAVSKSDLSQPELGSAPIWTSITGLLNYASRYNIRLSAARNFKRWQEFFNGCLKWYTTNDDFVFTSGEGNFDMVSTLSSTDCEGDNIALSEKQDIDGGFGQDFTFVPIIYEFEHPLTYAQYSIVKANRKNAIGVSRTASGHAPCHVLNLEYEITRGKGKFTVLLGQLTPIT